MADERPAMTRSRLVPALIGLVLALGVIFFIQRATRGPTPQTVASSALQSMRAQNRLVPFVARYVTVVSSKQSALAGLISSERTLILPGNVRYELDLTKLQDGDVAWDGAAQTLSVTLPEIEVAGPDVDLNQLREYGDGGLLGRLTDSDKALDAANRSRAVTDLKNQAMAPLPMNLARQAARQAIEQSFAMPLRAAGYVKARVVARFASDATPVTVPLDHSRSLNEVLAH